MGLDFSHGNAHWTYSGFNRFRKRLAAAIGFDLDEMDGFKLNGRSWNDMKDAIKPLLNHSDCDGDLTPDECRQVEPRLREIVSAWPDDDFDKQQALLLADGMFEAVILDESFEFT